MPRIVIGSIIGIAALAIAFRGVAVEDLMRSLASTDVRWVLTALVSLMVSLAAYATRWWLLLTPDHRSFRWRTFAAAAIVGQAVNIAIPARLGELARVYYVSAREEVSKVRLLATIVVEKIIDLAVFAVVVLFLLALMSMPAWLSRSGLALISIAALVVIATLLVAFQRKRIALLGAFLQKRLSPRWADRLERLVRSALLSLEFVRDARISLLVAVLSAIILVSSVATNYLLMRASGLDLPYMAPIFLLVILRIGDAPPSLPGKIGVFHYLVVLALSLFSVDRTRALSYAFLLYGVVVIPVVIAGACLFALFRPAPRVAARSL